MTQHTAVVLPGRHLLSDRLRSSANPLDASLYFFSRGDVGGFKMGPVHAYGVACLETLDRLSLRLNPTLTCVGIPDVNDST
eukprot:3816631-Amphidinium_carterae.2